MIFKRLYQVLRWRCSGARYPQTHICIERVNSIYNAGYGPNYTRQNARVLCRVMYIEGKMYEYAKSLEITLITVSLKFP